MTFHSTTWRNNQKEPNTNTHLLFFPFLFCYFLQRLTKTSLIPRSLLILSISSWLHPLPLLLLIFPLTTLESVCFPFWLFKVGLQSYSLSLVHLAACFDTAQTRLPHLVSPHVLFLLPLSLTLRLLSVCSLSCGCCIVNTRYPTVI